MEVYHMARVIVLLKCSLFFLILVTVLKKIQIIYTNDKNKVFFSY